MNDRPSPPGAAPGEPAQAFRGLAVEQAFGYSQARRGGDLVWVAGQVGRDEHGVTPAAPTFAESLALTLANVEWALGELGRQPVDILALQIFVAVPLAGALPELRRALAAWLGPARPALQLVEVTALNRPTFLVEISAVAADEQGGVMFEQAIVAGGEQEAALGASRAVRVGEQVFLGGHVAADLGGGAAEQLAGALAALAESLAACGATLADVVAEHIFLTEQPADAALAGLLAAHRAAFTGPLLPTSTMVYVPALPVAGATVMVTAQAVVTRAAGAAG